MKNGLFLRQCWRSPLHVAQILQIANVLHAPFDGIFIYSFSLCIVIPFIIAMCVRVSRATVRLS